MGRRKKCYAVYKGDDFIDLGSAEELANRLNLTVKTLQCYVASNRYKNTNHNRGGFTIFVIED